MTNIGQNFSLTQKNIPGLTYPVSPFLGAAAFSVSYSGKDRRRQDIAVDEWNFSIQREIAHETMLQVTYLGTKGTHLFRKGLSLNGIDPLTGKRPYANLTNSTIGWTVDDANSNLQALQVNLRRNLTTGLLISANYQWSHGISDGSNGDGESDTPENMNCRSCERGATDFDIRHNFTTSAIWVLPVGKGHQLLGSAPPLMNALLGGWQLSGIGTARTGLPPNVTLSRSASALPDGINGSQRPDVVPGQSLYPASQTPTLWLNPYAFAVPANGTWGNAGRNIVRGPGIWAADMSIEKRFPVRERLAVSFRADVFNVFNRAQIGNPRPQIQPDQEALKPEGQGPDHRCGVVQGLVVTRKTFGGIEIVQVHRVAVAVAGLERACGVIEGFRPGERVQQVQARSVALFNLQSSPVVRCKWKNRRCNWRR